MQLRQVWVDIDHMEDFDEKDWAEEMVSAVVQSLLVICCVTNSFHVPSCPVQEAFLLAMDTKVPGESVFGIKLTETCDMRVGAYGLYMDQVKYDSLSFSPHIMCTAFSLPPPLCPVLLPCDTPDMRPAFAYHLTFQAKVDANCYAKSRSHQSCPVAPILSTAIPLYCRYYDFSTDWLRTVQGDLKFTEMKRDIRRLKGFHDVSYGEDPDCEDVYGELGYVEEEGMLSQIEAAKGAVMLSYGWGKKANGVYPSQCRVLSLSQLLQNHGFRVWLDVDHMMGE
jgi:hypothetical protein